MYRHKSQQPLNLCCGQDFLNLFNSPVQDTGGPYHKLNAYDSESESKKKKVKKVNLFQKRVAPANWRKSLFTTKVCEFMVWILVQIFYTILKRLKLRNIKSMRSREWRQVSPTDRQTDPDGRRAW